MRQWIKRAIIGTPWEAPVKRAHSALTGSKSSLYDSQTIAIMRRVLRADSNAIDVGAFEGGMLRNMLRFAPRGHHFAFEPLPEKFERLQKAFPRTLVFPYALGAQTAPITYHFMLEHPALSGLRRRSGHLPNESVRELQVSMETLRRTRPVVIFECGVGGADYFESTPGEIFDFLGQEAELKVSLLGAWLGGRPPLSRESFSD